jgi:hypothetical protein
MKSNIARAFIEAGFIVFLFYTNLLMGQFTRSGLGRHMGLAWAIRNIFTWDNFGIAVIAAFAGYAIFEFLRERY